MKKWVVFLVVGALIGFLVWELMKEEPVPDVADKSTMQATNFELATLDGKSMQLAHTRGKITIINFWASWCDPCQYEAPHLQTFYEQNIEDVEILGVHLTKKDTIKDAKAFVEQYGLTFPILLDEEGAVSTMYGAFTIPTTIILNANGEIVKQYAGPMEEQFLNEVVNAIQ